MKEIELDTSKLSNDAEQLKKEMKKRIVGQEDAIDAITNTYQIFKAGLSNQEKPISSFLFLGPTGTGKTRTVEAMAEIFFKKNTNMLKIDCAEFSHSHEIARLIGSPPGYLGHNETPPYLSQKNIDRYQTDNHQFTLILFDEIEKANSSLWQLLLGILDKGCITLGNNKTVDLTKCIIFMTSNIGSKIIDNSFSSDIGFSSSHKDITDIHKLVNAETQKMFTPEFLNRIDHKIIFNNLKEKEIEQILEIELSYIKKSLETNPNIYGLDFELSPESKKFILQKGFDKRYGGRPLKRALEQNLIYKLSGLIGSGQLNDYDKIKIYFYQNKGLVFKKILQPKQADARAYKAH